MDYFLLAFGFAKQEHLNPDPGVQGCSLRVLGCFIGLGEIPYFFGNRAQDAKRELKSSTLP